MSCQTAVATLFSCSYRCYSRNHVVFPIQTCIQSFYPKSLYSSQTWPYIFGNMFRGSFQPSFEQFSLCHVVCLWLRDCATTLLRIHLCGRPWQKDCFHMKNRKNVVHNFQTHGTIVQHGIRVVQFQGSVFSIFFEKRW